jgi:CheY-like chemotaxis protein
MKTKHHSFYCQCTSYPPSILMVAKRSAQVLKIKQDLENNGCQVHFTGICCDDLVRVRQKYFDLMVLDVDQSDEQGWGVYKMLKSYPELAEIPWVILAACDDSGEAINELKKGPVYVLTKDASAAAMLLQIINQVHYLTYRYL